MTATPTIASTPSSPATIAREIGGLRFHLSAEGLEIRGLAASPVALDLDETLAVADFLRTAGCRQLINRSFLAQQHAEGLADGARDAE